MNIVMSLMYAVWNTFCVTRFYHPEMFQLLKDNVLSLTSSLVGKYKNMDPLY